MNGSGKSYRGYSMAKKLTKKNVYIECILKVIFREHTLGTVG